MERAVAVKKLTKLLGKKFGYRIDQKAAMREEREAAHVLAVSKIAERKRLEEQKNERCRVLLAADPEYQRLKADYELARTEVSRLQGIAMHYKITVGITGSMFFSVKAQGDSWEDVISQLDGLKEVERKSA